MRWDWIIMGNLSTLDTPLYYYFYTLSHKRKVSKWYFFSLDERKGFSGWKELMGWTYSRLFSMLLLLWKKMENAEIVLLSFQKRFNCHIVSESWKFEILSLNFYIIHVTVFYLRVAVACEHILYDMSCILSCLLYRQFLSSTNTIEKCIFHLHK